MSVSDSERFRLLILQIRFLKAQASVDEKILEEAQSEFAKAYQEVCKTVPEHERLVLEGALNEETEANVKKKKEKQQPQQPKEEEESDPDEEPEEIRTEVKNKKPEDPNVKKIYRDIARKSHPDKLADAPEEEKKVKEDLFKEAQTAIKERDFLKLYDIARQLDVDLPPPEEGQIKLLTNNVKKIKKGIKLIRETTAWQWHHEEDPHRKEALLITYMQYVYTRFK